MPFEIALKTQAAGRIGDDRATVVSLPGGHLLVLADGAGGTSGGAAAAETVVARAQTLVVSAPADCVRFLEQLDYDLTEVGQTTAVLLALFEDRLLGASVGDSAAWLVRQDDFVDLTDAQVQKPLLGSGRAKPAAFEPRNYRGRVVVGSDGLFKYVSIESILSLARASVLTRAPDDLIAGARLPSGALQDDIAVIVADRR